MNHRPLRQGTPIFQLDCLLANVSQLPTQFTISPKHIKQSDYTIRCSDLYIHWCKLIKVHKSTFTLLATKIRSLFPKITQCKRDHAPFYANYTQRSERWLVALAEGPPYMATWRHSSAVWYSWQADVQGYRLSEYLLDVLEVEAVLDWACSEIFIAWLQICYVSGVTVWHWRISIHSFLSLLHFVVRSLCCA